MQCCCYGDIVLLLRDDFVKGVRRHLILSSFDSRLFWLCRALRAANQNAFGIESNVNLMQTRFAF